jgi:uncharacterized protein (TIGR02145 family)
MKKIRSGATGLVAAVVGVAAAVALICAGCNDGGIADGDVAAERFINRFYGEASSGDGGDYVKLGVNTWMRKNLNVETEDSWCYENTTDNCEKYGRLYTWEAAKSACQQIDLRLPTKGEWEALILAAGGSERAGKKLKAKSGWYGYYDGTQDYNGTDYFGFSALPGGHRSCCYDDDGGFGFGEAGYVGLWWTATEDKDYEYDGDYASYSVLMDPNGHSAGVRGGYPKGDGHSVRCVLDD